MKKKTSRRHGSQRHARKVERRTCRKPHPYLVFFARQGGDFNIQDSPIAQPCPTVAVLYGWEAQRNNFDEKHF